MVLLYPPNNLLRYSHLNVCRLQYYSKGINTASFPGTLSTWEQLRLCKEVSVQVTNPRMRSQYEATNLMQGLAGSDLKQGPG